MPLNLSKGESLNLAKADGSKLTKIKLGLNWGQTASGETVDLDASVVMLDKDKKVVDTVFFGQKTAKDGSVKHSGDDTSGDVGGDDGSDNETIECNLERTQASFLALVINSFKKQKFGTIPHIGCRVLDGSTNEVLATYKLDNNPQFAESITAHIGTCAKDATASWTFKAVGQPTADKDLNETVANMPAAV